MLLSDPFGKWIGFIKSEYDYELLEAKSDLIPNVLDPSIRAHDLTPFHRAARLRIALDVIEEFASAEKEHTELKIVI